MNLNEGKFIHVDINKEMKRCYIDYAMSVIVGRALPDVRYGLKPVSYTHLDVYKRQYSKFLLSNPKPLVVFP